MGIRGNPGRIFCSGVKWGDLDKATFEEVVGYFDLRVRNSFFFPLNNLLLPEYKTTGLVILAVLSSLIDVLSQYYYWEVDIKHKDKYKHFLREHFPEFKEAVSLKRYPHVRDYADFFYEGFRCHILHNFMLAEHSTIGWKTSIIQTHVWDQSNDTREIIVNPRIMSERLEVVFTKYIADLLDPGSHILRERFAKKLFLDTGVRLNIKGGLMSSPTTSS